MKKFLLTLLCLLAVGATAMAEEWSWIYSSNTKASGITGNKTTTGSFKIGDVSWTFTADKDTKVANDGNFKGISVGGKDSGTFYSPSEFTISTTDSQFLNQSITKMSFGAGWNGSTSAKVTILVDNTEIYSTDLKASTNTETKKQTIDWAGEAICTESISIKYELPTAEKIAYFGPISITYEDATSVDPTKQEAKVSFGDASKTNLNFYSNNFNEFVAPVLTKTEGIEVMITSDNTDVATVDTEGNVTLTGAVGTATIKAEFEGNDTYNPASDWYIVNVNKAYSNIKDLLTAANNTNVYVDFPMTVAFVNGRNVFATDEAGDFIQLFDTNSYEANDIIPAGWNATYTLYNGATPELTPNPTFPEANGKGEFTPKTVAAADITTDLVNSVILVKNVALAAGAPDTKTNFDGTADGVELTLRNNYGLAGVSAGVYDITIVVTIYQGAPSLYTIGYEFVAPVAPEIADDHLGDLDENGVLTKAAETYTLKFKKVEGVDIYYKLILKENASNEPEEVVPDAPLATRADATTADELIEDGDHKGYYLHNNYENGITLTQNHSAIEYYAFANGVKSGEPTTLAVNLTDAGGTVGVAEIEAAGEGEARWFDLQGREVVKPAAGLYIRVAGGKAQKVIVK